MKKIKKSKKNPHSDWHIKIAQSRGQSWLKSVVEGKRDAILNPSLLRIARLEKGLDQADIAKSLKISNSSYCAIERGHQAVKAPLAKEISDKVGKIPVSLFEKHPTLKNKLIARTKRI